jgi:hypothetical protein
MDGKEKERGEEELGGGKNDIPKYIVSVLSVSSVVARAQDKRLTSSRPQGLIIEPRGVPNDLQHKLRDLDGVARRAVARRKEGRGPR